MWTYPPLPRSSLQGQALHSGLVAHELTPTEKSERETLCSLPGERLQREKKAAKGLRCVSISYPPLTVAKDAPFNTPKLMRTGFCQTRCHPTTPKKIDDTNPN